MFAFIGLGNPDSKYAGTRHNIGFRVIDAWLNRSRAQLAPVCDAFHAATIPVEQESVLLLKPMTYMNRSGHAVMEACRWYNLDTRQLVVIYDEVHLPFGVLRLRSKGSDGGHNGIASIIESLGTEMFARQRIGVSEPAQKTELIDYVLGPFAAGEEDQIPRLIDRACEQLRLLVTDGLVAAASRYNGALDL